MNIQRLFAVALGLAVFSSAAGAPSPALAGEFTLKKHSVRIIKVDTPDKRYWYDDRIPEKQVLALYAFLALAVKDPVPLIYAVPGLPGHYVVSSYDMRSTETDYGRRLYLVRETKTGFEVVDRTPGAFDSYILEPVFFLGRGRTLILAEIGTEYSWGLMVYEIRHKRLVYLGPLDATVEGDVDASDPTPFAAVKHANGRWLVEFSSDLLLDAGGLKEQKLLRKGKRPIVFEQKEKGFAPVPGTYVIQDPETLEGGTVKSGM